MTTLRFVTIADVAPLMSGHLDRFPNPESFDAACRDVWRAADHDPSGATIARSAADQIMERAINGERA